MRRRRRITSTTDTATQARVVRGVLVDALTIEQAALTLGIPCVEVRRLVNGARRAVIAALGPSAIDAVRRTDRQIAVSSR
jgi:DNA-directed RNA polymerase specialized sigma24 family protein